MRLGEPVIGELRHTLPWLELLLEQIKAVEAGQNTLFAAAKAEAPTPAPVTMLLDIKGIGPEFAAILWMEAFFRSFANRKQIAAYAGLAPTPWQSGAVNCEQGVSKSGNPRLRTTRSGPMWVATPSSQWTHMGVFGSMVRFIGTSKNSGGCFGIKV